MIIGGMNVLNGSGIISLEGGVRGTCGVNPLGIPFHAMNALGLILVILSI